MDHFEPGPVGGTPPMVIHRDVQPDAIAFLPPHGAERLRSLR